MKGFQHVSCLYIRNFLIFSYIFVTFFPTFQSSLSPKIFVIFSQYFSNFFLNIFVIFFQHFSRLCFQSYCNFFQFFFYFFPTFFLLFPNVFACFFNSFCLILPVLAALAFLLSGLFNSRISWTPLSVSDFRSHMCGV